jgi:spermidine synthase
MSSRFTAAEVALADIGLSGFAHRGLDVAVGGLGLGFTAKAALAHAAVDTLLVVEALAPVIEWHEAGLLPLGAELTVDPRCRFALGDFFAMLEQQPPRLDPDRPERKFDAVLLDIDHAPGDVLDPAHTRFYTPEGLQRLAGTLKRGGVFALWSNDPPEQGFLSVMQTIFSGVEAREVRFGALHAEAVAANTIYLGTRP